jgi:Protein of unknown function (DUF1566)
MNTQSTAFVKDKWTKLDWRIQHEGRFSLQGALEQFKQPDYDGWRLPTFDELKTLIDNKDVVKKFLPHSYDTSAMWSSTRCDESQASAINRPIIPGTLHHWAMMLSGDSTLYSKSAFLVVRLVRSNTMKLPTS